MHCLRTVVLATVLPMSLAVSILAQQRGSSAPANATPPLVLANDQLEFSISTMGGKFLKLQLRGSEPLNPFHTIGHFLALDGFGAPSSQEQAAGMPFHGEASRQPVDILSRHDSGPVHSIVMQSFLPLAQEKLTRTIELADGENIIHVSSEVESALNIDRPISWAEHATIGPPFLEPGKTFVDMPATNCQVRPYKPGPIPGRLIYGRDFKWPMAPANNFERADIRSIPSDKKFLDLASCQLDPNRTLAFVTALNVDKRLLLGYVFPREEYPWVMSWMNYTGDQHAARGMEFSTQPFDISHRETVEMNPLFGTPAFKWLPAKSKIQSRFLLFYTAVPEGFTRVDEVKIEAGKLIVQDHASGQQIVLASSRGL
ncbi:MAG TPA: hypothetical protein VK604_10855 [Bryobacteraceae bacterium]|nr:hypothetical protein [Bryobacteraceae bacterium]